VRVIAIRQLSRFGEQLNGGDQFLDVFAVSALASDIPSKLRMLPDAPHARS